MPPPPEHEGSDDLTLRTGETTTIRLPGLATAGYRWEAVAEDDTVLEVSTDFEPGDDSGATTSNRDELLEVTARRTGTTTVRLRQRRPWEPDGEAAAERELKVNVVADDNTTERRP